MVISLYWFIMSFEIRYRDESNGLYGSMYRVDICYDDTHPPNDQLQKIDDWIKDNLDSFDCLKYGQMYIFEHESDIFAFKMMWE